MSKNLKVLGIGVLLISLAVAGQSQKTAEKTQDNMENQKAEMKSDVEVVKGEEQEQVRKNDVEENKGEMEELQVEDFQNTKNLMFKKFTSEESEKLKKEKDLVWYEIPEVGIKFLVTKNQKIDLKYNTTKDKDSFGKDKIYISFYSKSEVNYKTDKLGYNCLGEGGNIECLNGIFLSKISTKANDSMKKSIGEDARFVCKYNRDGRGQTILLVVDDYYICGEIDHQSFDWNTQEEYEEFLKAMGATEIITGGDNKEYNSLYFGAITKINNK